MRKKNRIAIDKDLITRNRGEAGGLKQCFTDHSFHALLSSRLDGKIWYDRL